MAASMAGLLREDAVHYSACRARRDGEGARGGWPGHRRQRQWSRCARVLGMPRQTQAKDSLLPHFRGWRGWIAVILSGNSTHLQKAAATMKRWRRSQRRFPLTSGKPLRNSMLDWALPRSKSQKSLTTRPSPSGGLWPIAATGRRHCRVVAQCHGAAGQGVGKTFPRLAGQSAEYIMGQLKAWKDGKRTDDPLHLMTGIASKLDDDQVVAVAAYYASLPVLAAAPTTPQGSKP